MSSSSKFPSGLNNWAGSDKPMRVDFVNDNEILDENAMWKAAYDTDGEVAQAGGIPAYALDKATYDADGEVARLGGIMAAVATTAGFATYTHGKQGTTHTLVNETGGDNIKFIATADFEYGDSLLVNGISVAVLDSDGAPVNRAFCEGDTVVMLRNGNEVRVAVPLGNRTNFNVITGGTEPPAEAPEDSIWVPDPFSRVSYSSLQPENPITDELWLPAGGSLQVRGRAIRDMLYAISRPFIYSGADWASQASAMLMRNGAWMPFNSARVLYSYGQEYVLFAQATTTFNGKTYTSTLVRNTDIIKPL